MNAPLDAEPAAPPPGLLGSPVQRREDARLLAGLGTYLADVPVQDAIEVVFVRSMQAHARILSVDCAAARELPGVLAVLTGDDIPERTLVDDFHEFMPDLDATPQPVLARERVRFVGEPIAMVLASNRYIGEDAADLVEVTYEDLPPVLSVEQAMAAESHALGPHGSNVVLRDHAVFGDPDRAFEQAHHVTSYRLDTNRYAAMPLEGRGCIATYDAGRGRMEFWSSTQSEFVLRRKLASVTGLAEGSIRVRVPDVGGGFGQKIPISPEEAAIALASMQFRRPLRWVEDRSENLMAAPHAKQQTLELQLAIAADGEFLGMRARIAGDIGAYSSNIASALIEPYIGSRYLPGPYKVEHYACEVTAVLTNKSPIAPYRGTGTTAANAALELLIDACAEETGLDRFALRARNLLRSDEFPYRTCTNKTYDSGSHAESLERISELVDFDGFRERQAELRSQGVFRGLGVAMVVESTGRPLIGRWKSSYDGARIALEPDGGITLDAAVSSQGQAHETVLAQVAADALGVPLDQVTVRAGDTDSAPLSTYGTRASRTAVMSGGAVRVAATELRARILDIASAITECPVDQLTIADGVVRPVGASEPAVDLRTLAQKAYFDPQLRGSGQLPELSVTRGYDAPIVYSNACYAIEVEVDTGLGNVSVERITVVEDCGTMINPLVVDGQTRGAIIQGIGGALLEELKYDEVGQLQTATLTDYRVPRSCDIPDIEIHHLSSPSPFTIFGAKGVGESGSIGAPAAVAAAVTDALRPFGATVHRLPLDPDRILGMIAEAESHPATSGTGVVH